MTEYNPPEYPMIPTYASAIPAELTVNQLIRNVPSTVQIFNDFGIDACCGGAVRIAEAAQRDGADVDALLSALAAVIRSEA